MTGVGFRGLLYFIKHWFVICHLKLWTYISMMEKKYLTFLVKTSNLETLLKCYWTMLLVQWNTNRKKEVCSSSKEFTHTILWHSGFPYLPTSVNNRVTVPVLQSPPAKQHLNDGAKARVPRVSYATGLNFFFLWDPESVFFRERDIPTPDNNNNNNKILLLKRKDTKTWNPMRCHLL